MNQLYLKISVYNFRENSRDARELHVAETAGFNDIGILTFEGQRESYLPKNWRLFEVARNKYGSSGYRKIASKIHSVFSFIHKSRELKPKVISGHDLLGLTIGYISSFGRRKNMIFIYDAHEYELGRYTVKPRSRFALKIIAIWEKYLIKHSDLSIVVNQSIANQMQMDYKINFNSVVVRNIPVKQELDRTLSREIRESWLKKMNLPFSSKLLMYHGLIQEGRGIEIGIDLCAKFKHKNLGFIILGYGSSYYINKLQKKADKLGIRDRVIFNQPVLGNVLLDYVAASDIGLVLIQPVSKSYNFALPNKLFENIHAGIPVLASSLPEINQLVKDNQIGLTCNIDDIDDISDKIRLLLNESCYNQCVENILKVRFKYTWENEALILKSELEKIYNSLIQ